MSTGRFEPPTDALGDNADALRSMRAVPEYIEDENSGGGMKRYIAALLRHKWLIVGLGALGLAAGVGVGKLLKPTYMASATLQIDVVPRGSQQQTGPIRTTQLLDSRGWIDLLRSYAVLDEVVRRRRLFIDHDNAGDATFFEAIEVDSVVTPGTYSLAVAATGGSYTLESAAGASLESGVIGDSIGRTIGLRWAPPSLPAGRVFDFRLSSTRDAAVRLSALIENSPMPPDAAFLRISLTGTDPVDLATTVNVIANRYVEVATFLKRDKLTQVTQVLGAQLERSLSDLRQAENALETFKVNTITLPSDRGATPIASGLTETRDPVREAFFRLRLDVDSLQQEREAISRAIQGRTDTSLSLLVALGTIPSVRNSPELSASLQLLADKRAEARQLRLAFGPGHVPLQEVVQTVSELETRTIPAQAREVLSSLDQRIRDLDQRISASGREMQQIPARVSEEARRERDVLIADNLYTALQAAYEQARLAELSAAPDVRVLDAAQVPNRPLKDQLLIVLVGGLVGGLGIGAALAILLDRFDKRIRYPEQVSQELGLEILGALPRLGQDRSGQPSAEDAAHLLEAIRSIRMNLGFAHGLAGPFVTTITSPGAGDGKSFFAANLARAFASTGRRTLLIDADTRRGVLHRSMGVSRKPGLLDFLSGLSKREEIVRAIGPMGIDFIPSGTRQSGGPELLGSQQMTQLLMALRTEYDAVIIDSPPLGAGVDPLLLASLSGSLVLVLRTGVTDRELAESRLTELKRLPIRILGAVLNDVRPGGVYRYYSYLPGYRAVDESAETEDGPPAKKDSPRFLKGAG